MSPGRGGVENLKTTVEFNDHDLAVGAGVQNLMVANGLENILTTKMKFYFK